MATLLFGGAEGVLAQDPMTGVIGSLGAAFPCSQPINREFSVKWGVFTDISCHNQLLSIAFLYDFPVLNYQGIWPRVSGNMCLQMAASCLRLLSA
jgi:hypothetical protein